MAQMNEDPRPLPTLGWCAECIRAAGWNRAATLWEGTALCAQHLIYKAGIGDIDIEEENAPYGKPQAVIDQLRRSMHAPGKYAGF
ncbi:hypothetical protein [Streptomyces sp. bgisy082]|uniref:hypothetical protein n=1 Tax=Streptomyces sp. bgisy082 TaxID=3413776 RepID=UPI003D74C573